MVVFIRPHFHPFYRHGSTLQIFAAEDNCLLETASNREGLIHVYPNSYQPIVAPTLHNEQARQWPYSLILLPQ